MHNKSTTCNPHYANPLHIRAAFKVWLLWRNSPVFRAAVRVGAAIPLAGALWALLALVLTF